VRQVRLGRGGSPPDGFSPIDSVLAARDLDGDGFGDLVVGPRPLRLYRGRAAGVSRRPTRTLKAPKGARAGFGAVLALGDIDGDGHIDVIEGAPGNALDLDEGSVSGHMTFCRGTPSGPKACRRVLGDRPGPASLAVADVTGDGRADVIAGVPVMRFHGEDSSPPGGVLLFPGGRRGPGAPVTITPASAGVPGVRRPDDSFGASVAAGKLDGDRFADFVVGGAGSIRAQGRAWIIRGGPSGHATSGNLVVDEATPGIPGRRSRLGGFGMAASVLGTDGHGRPEVIVGVAGLRNGDRGAGALTVLRVARNKLKLTRARSHSLRSLKLNAPEAPDAFLTTPGFGGALGHPGASSSTGDMFFQACVPASRQIARRSNSEAALAGRLLSS
jgi:hypothetical protein